MTNEPKCNHTGCNLPPNKGWHGYCILHYDSPDKDATLFQTRLEEKIQREKHDTNTEIIDLSNVIFPDVTDFREKLFKKPANFHGAKFTKRVTFRDAKFEAKVDFDGAQFESVATFIGTEFMHLSTFSNAKFSSDAEFAEAKFQHLAQFRATEFVGNSYFWSVLFSHEANFGGAMFTNRADFGNAVFCREVRFTGTRFGSWVDFNGTNFENGGGFTRAIIFEGASFIGASFHSKSSNSDVKFHDVVLRNADMVRFENVDLAKVSFLRTDVSHFSFVGCTWPVRRDRRYWLPFWPRERLSVYDELALDADGATDEQRNELVPLVAQEYRQLRINYEASRQEVEAGDFYVGQMEMRRREHANHLCSYRFLLIAYRVAALYGESYLRPFAWYLLLAPLFALGYWWLGTESYGDNVFAALTAGRLFTDIHESISGWEKMLVYLNMLADILLLSLTVIALRRRLHR